MRDRQTDSDRESLTNASHKMCILAGCDYLPSLPGMGVKTAFKFVKSYKNIEQVRRWGTEEGGGGVGRERERERERERSVSLYVSVCVCTQLASCDILRSYRQ